MRGLLGRLVLSHLFVAVVGAAATFLLVRLLAPQMFDQEMQAMGGGMGRGLGLREQFASAVDSALLVGVVVGVLAAGALGAVAAYRLTRPLAALAATTRRLAAGEYAVAVPAPGTAELDDLADSVRALARALHETELRRTRLLGEVTHEMRTPLTVLDGFLEGMIDGVVPADPPTLAQLSAETRRLRRLADDLSALSRAEEGRIELHVVEADLTAVVKGGKFHPTVRRQLEQTEQGPANGPETADCAAERTYRDQVRAAVLKTMDALKLDAFVHPTWSNPPRLIGDLNTPGGDNSQFFSPTTGWPAIQVPMGYTRGVLPAGITFFGRAWTEADLLGMAYAYEQHTRHRRPPASTPPLR